MKAWLKGGMICCVIIFLFANIFWYANDYLNITIIHSLSNLFTELTDMPYKLLILLPEISLKLFNSDDPLIFAVSIIFYFIFGALIGLILGKIKSKKENKQK